MSSPATAGALIRTTLHRQHGRLFGSVALITIWQVCEAAVPVLIGVVIDRAVATGDIQELLLWAIVLCGHFALLSFAYRYGARLGFRGLMTESHRLRTDVSAHVLRPEGARTNRLPGEVLSMATADADMVGFAVRQIAVTAAALVGLVVSGAVLAFIDPLLALVVLGGVPIVLVLTQVLAPRLARKSEARQANLGRATGHATDLIRGLRPLKGIGAETVAGNRYREQSRKAARASVAAAQWEGLLYGITQLVTMAFLALVALLAGFRAIEGDLSIGELIAVVGLAQFVAEPMSMLAFLVAQMAKSKASAQRIVDFLATPPLVTGGDRYPNEDHTLELADVTFGPLRDASFSVGPGQMLAVMCEQPGDAAALMTLLRAEATPDYGTVTLAGAPITDLHIDESRELLLVADHHIDLFEGTLRSNLDPTGKLTDEQLAQVLTASAAVDVVTTSPQGLDEPVAVNGTSLSGGQRQRLGLARALATRPRMLVLHDPTTAVDSVSEQHIADSLRETRNDDTGPRTTLVLTSSPAWLARATAVVHLRDGRVVAHGIHSDLLQNANYRTAVLR